MDVQLVQQNSNPTMKPLAILLQVQEETHLVDVRNIIAEQVSDIMPPGRYSFCLQGTAVSELMEREIKLKQIVQKGDDAFNVAVLSIDFLGQDIKNDSQGETNLLNKMQRTGVVSSETYSTYSDYKSAVTNSKDDSGKESMNILKSLPRASLLPETSRNVLKLRSPTTTEVRNLKTYTDVEIKQGKGKYQEYKKFWNDRVRKMAKDRSLSKSKIYKRINEEWRLHRSKYLVNDSADTEELVLQNRKEKVNTSTDAEPKAKKMKATTVPSNITRVKTATSSIESLQAEIKLKTEDLKQTDDPKTKKDNVKVLSQLQMRLNASMSELRKAQDTLRKNLKKLSKCNSSENENVDKETET